MARKTRTKAAKAKAAKTKVAKKAGAAKHHPDHNPKAGVRVVPPSKEALAREEELEEARTRTEYKPAPKADTGTDEDK